MIKILKSKRYKQLIESERKLKSVESVTGSAQQLIEKRQILESALIRTNEQLSKMYSNYSNLKTANGNTLRDYKRMQKKNNRLK